MTLDFGEVDIVIAGDVCRDILVFGKARRFSRETPGVPVVDVEQTLEVDGGTAVAFRQAIALGANATLVPTGPSVSKTRLFAAEDGVSRELVRWDDPWTPQDGGTFTQLLRATQADTLLYCQYRPGRPREAVLRTIRAYGQLRVGDVKTPAHFVGILHVVKVAMDDAWDNLQRPRPQRTPSAALAVAGALTRNYGYRLAVITMGSMGYAAASSDGTEFLGPALPGGHRTSGAGDIFAATLACTLAAKHEVRDALAIANTAAGLASRKEGHLETVTAEEISQWST